MQQLELQVVACALEDIDFDIVLAHTVLHHGDIALGTIFYTTVPANTTHGSAKGCP